MLDISLSVFYPPSGNSPKKPFRDPGVLPQAARGCTDRIDLILAGWDQVEIVVIACVSVNPICP
jgi:hypothetical protein